MLGLINESSLRFISGGISYANSADTYTDYRYKTISAFAEKFDKQHTALVPVNGLQPNYNDLRVQLRSGIKPSRPLITGNIALSSIIPNGNIGNINDKTSTNKLGSIIKSLKETDKDIIYNGAPVLVEFIKPIYEYVNGIQTETIIGQRVVDVEIAYLLI